MNRTLGWASTLAIVFLLSSACVLGLGEPTPPPEASTQVEEVGGTAVSTTEVASTPTPPPVAVAAVTTSIARTTPAPTATPTHTPTPGPTSTPTPTPEPTPTPTPTFAPVPPPEASFSTVLTEGRAPLFVKFNNTSRNRVSSVEWDFGDVATSIADSPVHSYTVAGIYTVRLTARGPGGTDTRVMSVTSRQVV